MQWDETPNWRDSQERQAVASAPGNSVPPRFPLSACGSLNKGIWVAWEAGGCREIPEFSRPEGGKKGDRAGRGR